MRYQPLFLLIFVGCGSPDGYDCFCRSITDYDVSPSVQTLGGIDVDPSGMDINLNAIDRDTEKLETCLELSIDRGGFNVKVAPDWYVFPDDRRAQVFPCDLPPSYCGNKPMCVCAGVVQPPRTIVITPNLKAYRHELIHLVAGAHFHDDAVFARCENWP